MMASQGQQLHDHGGNQSRASSIFGINQMSTIKPLKESESLFNMGHIIQPGSSNYAALQNLGSLKNDKPRLSAFKGAAGPLQKTTLGLLSNNLNKTNEEIMRFNFEGSQVLQNDMDASPNAQMTPGGGIYGGGLNREPSQNLFSGQLLNNSNSL